MDYKSRSFKRKKRGAAGFFAKIGGNIANWWKNLKKWKKVVLCVITAIILVVAIVASVFLSLFDCFK